ncbi:unnamed protein product, partial [Amoebophrya sp. A120]
ANEGRTETAVSNPRIEDNYNTTASTLVRKSLARTQTHQLIFAANTSRTSSMPGSSSNKAVLSPLRSQLPPGTRTSTGSSTSVLPRSLDDIFVTTTTTTTGRNDGFSGALVQDDGTTSTTSGQAQPLYNQPHQPAIIFSPPGATTIV